jgi:hypothetical protein
MRGTRRDWALLLCAVVVSACGDVRQSATEPSSSPVIPSPLPPASNTPNWSANATVTSVKPGSARACGWGTLPGETRSDVLWRITAVGDQIVLDEDMKNWPTDDIPFSGKLTARQFSATYRQTPDYAQYVCQFREGTLSGSFGEDGTSFEALETLVWGTPGSETTVQRKWVGRRL